MPTQAECKELFSSDNCTCKWTTMNGVKGCKVISKISGYEGKYIFLPTAGIFIDSDLVDVGFRGGYWSSSLYTAFFADDLFFYLGNSSFGTSNYYRNVGQSVRPVCL